MVKVNILVRLISMLAILLFPLYIYTGCDSTIELPGTEIREYEGYWESRGYSNNADLDEYLFD
jgi:hypothetical protein